MSTIKLNGTSSGSSIIKAPDSGSTNQTFTLPASSGTLVTTTDAGVAGITSSAGATAMTIDANEVITITQPNSGLDTSFVVSEVNGNNPELLLKSNRDNSSNYRGANIMSFGRGVGDTTADVRSATISMLGLQGSSTGKIKGKMQFVLANDDTSASETVLELTHDGRGLSQFTAKAWLNFNDTTINDSHNISSMTDVETGISWANFSNNMANTNYAVSGMAYSSNCDKHGPYIAGQEVGRVKILSMLQTNCNYGDRTTHIVIFGD